MQHFNSLTQKRHYIDDNSNSLGIINSLLPEIAITRYFYSNNVISCELEIEAEQKEKAMCIEHSRSVTEIEMLKVVFTRHWHFV